MSDCFHIKIYITADISIGTKFWCPLVPLGLQTSEKCPFYLINLRLEPMSGIPKIFQSWFLIGKSYFQAKRDSISFKWDVIECKSTKITKNSRSFMTPPPTTVHCIISFHHVQFFAFWSKVKDMGPGGCLFSGVQLIIVSSYHRRYTVY